MSHRTTRAAFRKAPSAIGIAALTLAASTLSITPAWGAASGPSGTVKIITWVNPPAVSAFKKIDAEFEKAYPNIKVRASDGRQRDDRVRNPSDHNGGCCKRRHCNQHL